MKKLLFILLGIDLGIVMYKAETASWFRIFEMFHFQSFHMYGFIGSALIVGLIGINFLKKSNATDCDGNPICIQPKNKSVARYLLGGIAFGLGWALVGACPGPIFVMLGSGLWMFGLVILSALVGTFFYGIIKDKLPH